MNLEESNYEKKIKTSFWGKLFRTSKKSHPKTDESFRRHSFFHSSFHSTKPAKVQNEEDEVNFTTLDNSDLMEMHRDAGIIFVNKNHVHNLLSKEEEKRVQFVPTPMNKYYQVNTKAAPSKSFKKGENKENLNHIRQANPSRPILRVGKSHENLSQKLVFTENTSDNQNKTKLINASYFEGPEIDNTSLMPRTSTKSVLFDRKNGSLPHLNLSGIPKYGTLPKPSNYNAENASHPNFDKYTRQINGNSQNQPLIRSDEASVQFSHLQHCNFQKSSHKIEHQPITRQERGRSKHGKSHRYSLGEPIRLHDQQQNLKNLTTFKSREQQQELRPNNTSNTILARNCDMNPNQREKVFQNPPEKYLMTKKDKRNLYPDKSMNEIGLPVGIIKSNNQQHPEPKLRSRSESPHYIPLAETYSSNTLSTQAAHTNYVHRVNDHRANIPQMQSISVRSQCQPTALNKVCRTKSTETFQRRPLVPYERISQHTVVNNSENFRYISQTKKQAIVTKMYSKKRMLVNKMCKYKSKDCDDGFSSMADDECSFNCSCSSCINRFSRKSGKIGPSNQLNDDKYFFICTDNFESKEERHLETVFESPLKVVDQKSYEERNIDKDLPSTLWYECNDFLCKTPQKGLEIKLNETNHLNVKDNQNCSKHIDNIYENITQIINSATKQNFHSQDIQRMFSTPLSKKERLNANANIKSVPRSLFPSEQKENTQSITPLERQKKNLISPLKSPLFCSDSIILLQEIFQKLSQECKELLKPSIPSNVSADSGKHDTSISSNCSGDKYVNDLVKSLQAEQISEGDFANIIGNIAQNIFLETKAKRKSARLDRTSSLPDLTKTPQKQIQPTSSMVDIFNLKEQQDDTKANCLNKDPKRHCNVLNGNPVESSKTEINSYERKLPEGWSKTPSSTSDQCNIISDAANTSKNDSTTSESGLELLENTIRIGMGLPPLEEASKQLVHLSSPAKSFKYKSKDVLSCKGKLKLKIYHNSGLVTVHVVKAAKLSKQNCRNSLNAYLKISMVPDEAKRVNWRTTVQKNTKNPAFKQIFSFEVSVEDMSKRLVFSVWHRDFEKKRSELVGCMSFSVKHVLDNSHKINGWYRLLREGFGTEKHFAAHANKDACPLKNKEKLKKNRQKDLL